MVSVSGDRHMKVVILAGGKGTRISEESQLRPKPMVEIGGMPILWHIMKHYARYGLHEFIICCGYKGRMIKEYFIHYYTNRSDCTFSLKSREVEMLERHAEPWRVTCANTGLETLTAGRILKIRDYIGEDEQFLLTYGDGVSDVDIDSLIAFHRQAGATATITATQPAGRFGTLRMDETTHRVTGFHEKARTDAGWVNAGFMVMNRNVFDYLGDGSEMLEQSPFKKLANAGEMAAYCHDGFWSPMDTVHDRAYLERLWAAGEAPWKTW